MATSPSSQRVADAARALGLEIEVREFPEGTRTAEDAAAAIGVDVGQIVKSLVYFVDGRPVLCLVSGLNRLDTQRLAVVAGASAGLPAGRQVRRARADEVERVTGFAIGGVPPFGHQQRLPVYCDRDLMTYDLVWAAAGTPRAVFAIEPQRLVQACLATIVDLKQEEE
jgi:prolyl-tRNA editing enzyme YbaK/EbsC (Cys-tRNA(Pro) deacylase)